MHNGDQEENKRDCFKLLTYNLFLRPKFIKNKASDYKEERLRDFRPELFKFDIICFQETFYGLTDYKGKLVKYALQAGLIHMVTG